MVTSARHTGRMGRIESFFRPILTPLAFWDDFNPSRDGLWDGLKTP